MDCSSLASPVHGISEARILEWVAISSSRESSRPRDQTHVPVSNVLPGGFFITEPLGKAVSIKYYLQKQIAGQILALCCGLPAL